MVDEAKPGGERYRVQQLDDEIEFLGQMHSAAGGAARLTALIAGGLIASPT